MLVVFIVVPSAILGIGLVTLFDRIGAFAGLAGAGGAVGGGATSGRQSSGLAPRIPRVGLVGVLVVMGVWVLAWVVLLVVGLGILSG